MCGKKNIWSLNCQKLFITPLLEIFRPKISLIAENTDWFQHWSCRGPGDRSRVSGYIFWDTQCTWASSCSALLLSSVIYTQLISWWWFFFVLRLSQLRNCVSTERSTSDPFHFTTSVKLNALLEPTVFIFPEQEPARCLLAVTMGSRAAPPWPGSLVGGGRPLIGQAAYSLPIASQW